MELASGNALSRFSSYTKAVSKWAERIGAVAFVGMFVATCVDVIGAKAFTWPLPGATEIVFMFQVIAIAGGLAYSKIDDRHIIVDFLVNMLPRRTKAAFMGFSSLLGLALFILIGWQSLKYGFTFWANQQVTTSAKIPYYPFPIWIFICCIPLCFVLLIEIINSVNKMVKK